jgi:hypothetical protein
MVASAYSTENTDLKNCLAHVQHLPGILWFPDDKIMAIHLPWQVKGSLVTENNVVKNKLSLRGGSAYRYKSFS